MYCQTVKLFYIFRTLFQNNYICGEKARTSNATPLIINGKNSAKGDYPWLAGLYYNDKHICAGNLISNQHIITGIIFVLLYLLFEQLCKNVICSIYFLVYKCRCISGLLTCKYLNEGLIYRVTYFKKYIRISLN